MGLFNHLFGSKKSLAKESEMGRPKRMALWKDHIENYFDRKDLASSFISTGSAKAIADWPSLMSPSLTRSEALISKEIITVENEEAVDAEVIADLKHFASGESVERAKSFRGRSSRNRNKENPMLELFKLHHMLNVELQVIRLIRQKPANVKDLLTGLFRTICINENEAMAIF